MWLKVTPATEGFECKIDGDKFIIGTPSHEIKFKITWGIATMMFDQIRSLLVPPYIQKEGMYEEIDGQRFMMEFVMTSNDYWAMDMRYGSDQLYAELTQSQLGNIARLLQSYLDS